MASSSSLALPSSSLSRSWEHDVFPSFHGPDVRKHFLSHLLKEFRNKGINPFIDNEIRRGESIGPELRRAIRGSKISIVLLSKNYASSSWCLDELVEIMNKEFGQTVITIFYEVDPSDVKKCSGDFGKVFNETCQGKTKEKIEIWKIALMGVATIAGYHSRNWVDEAAMIENIASDISNMLNQSAPSSDLDCFIGLRAHMENMKLLLRMDLEEVRMIGIWGPPGIGKSTIARFIFNQLSSCFQLGAIMVNIKGSYPRPCLDEGSAQLQLQNQMLSQMVNQKDIMISHLGVAQERLKDKNVLLVLDDVDRLAQLDALAKEVKWFGSKSRIIITTEDLRVLHAHGINHIYKVDFPSDDEALQMFCMYAFGQKFPKAGFTELAHEVTSLAGKLPLGLKVMGSYFRRMSKQEWIRVLPRLRNRLDGEIESILRFSYDDLCDEDKVLFLHIACYFTHDMIEKVEEHLSKKLLNVWQGIDVLIEKSLISISWGPRIQMHSLLVQLGKEIVRKQSDQEPGKRQFLVNDNDICEVFSDPNAIARSVIGIYSRDTMNYKVNIRERTFEGMSNLQFLRLSGDISLKPQLLDHPNIMSLPESLKYISPKLQLLHWEYSPMTCLPFMSNLEFLVELIMVHSKLERLWEGIKLLQNLKWMDLSCSVKLKELPNLSTASNLQKLNLTSCSSLVKLPSSIGNATNLQDLNLSCCSSLVELPSSIGNATNLQDLNLSYCSSLVKLPSSIGSVANLQDLDLSYCSSLVELPSSFGNASNLGKLILWKCTSLVKLPSSIGNVTNLQGLGLGHCSSLVELPSSIGNLTNFQALELSYCSNLRELPYSIGNATNLQDLNLSYCSRLVELPSSIGNASNLHFLDLTYCSSLVELPSLIGNATNLQILDLSYCSRLMELPSSLGNATNLQTLDLRYCSSIIELPSSIGNTTNLGWLDLGHCSSLVKLPSSIKNLHRLTEINLEECSKLEVLPTNIHMESLIKLNLTNCSSLKSFPEISTNMKILKLNGTAVEKVPSGIWSWCHLEELHMSYCENLKYSPPHALYKITHLYSNDAEIKELGPWLKVFSRLNRLQLSGCRKLVSLPQLPTSIMFLNVENCESLKILHWPLCNPDTHLNFRNCFKLDQVARDLIIQAPNNSVLPGEQVPACFTYRDSGSFLTVKLNEKPLRSSIKFKACFLLVREGEDEVNDGTCFSVSCSITSKQNASTSCTSYGTVFDKHLSEHLYIFDVEAEEVTSTELVFEFKLEAFTWKIKECGVLQLLDLELDEHYEYELLCERFSTLNLGFDN